MVQGAMAEVCVEMSGSQGCLRLCLTNFSYSDREGGEEGPRQLGICVGVVQKSKVCVRGTVLVSWLCLSGWERGQPAWGWGQWWSLAGVQGWEGRVLGK